MRSPLAGPPPALPGVLDAVAERWARLPPRARFLLIVLCVAAVSTLQALRLDAVQERWGGTGQRVWQATRTVPAGQDPRDALRAVRLPRAAIPRQAVTGTVPRGAVLAVALVDGTILTDIHLSPAGPAAALAPGERLVPVPVEQAWGVEEGSVVDVWAVPGDRADPQRIASGRPVVQVRQDRGTAVALVSLAADDVAAATASLSRGRVLLTLGGR